MNDNQILVIVLFVSCMLATALICGIGLLMHIRNRKKKSFFEMEFKVRPMPKCKPALDYPETNHYDAVDALASALRAYKIPKADSFDPERLTLKEYLELAGYKRGNTEIDIKERQDNGWPCSKPIKSTTFYKKDNTIIKIIKGDQIAEEGKKQFIGEKLKSNCKHAEYLKELTRELDKMSLTFIERHYIYTTAFSYLHHDKDHCDCNE